MSDGEEETLARPDLVGVDSYLVPEAAAKPRSFAGLMSVYESNYLRMCTLVTALGSIAGEHWSVVAADLPLHLTVTERTRYTCTLGLTYWFDADGDSVTPEQYAASDAGARQAWFRDPDLRLRIYFDGKLAEVMNFSESHRHAVLRDIAASHREALDIRWRRNMMLNKWLDFCLDSGHRFD